MVGGLNNSKFDLSIDFACHTSSYLNYIGTLWTFSLFFCYFHNDNIMSDDEDM